MKKLVFAVAAAGLLASSVAASAQCSHGKNMTTAEYRAPVVIAQQIPVDGWLVRYLEVA